ncbi:MAG TPA: ATP-binding cassette domain-containing protein [Rhodothermia bacterium]|nr:ATP-binding cassette domain-containing protein [Rhodothermia bacterium]
MEEHLAIQVEQVTKRYGTFAAVKGISFSVKRRSVFGLIGPNGAGKTTTIRMIMNILAPDSGSISILGRPSTSGVSKLIGYLPEERGLYRRMNIVDHLVFLAEIRGVQHATARKRALGWLERLQLGEQREKKVEELSKGQQQKIQFIGCAIHEPEIFVLDEPLSGLDPVNSRVLLDLIREFQMQGKTVMFSTHVMEQAEKLCDEIVLIDRAQIVLQGPLSEVKRQHSRNRLILRGSGSLDRLRSLVGVRRIDTIDGQMEVELDRDVVRSEFVRRASAVYNIESLLPHEASLEEIFVNVVSGNETVGRNEQ